MNPNHNQSKQQIATLYSKARATKLTGYKFRATFSQKNVHCSQVSNEKKNSLDHETFYQSNIEDLYISALTTAKTNLNDYKFRQTKAQPENWKTFKFFQIPHIKPHLKDTKVI